ncbi:MAG: glycine cleavage system protein GcvH [Sulfobacillus sp.]
MDVPKSLLYTQDHEWVQIKGQVGRVGITAFAQDQLGDIVFVELPKVGASVTAGAAFGVVESVKSMSDLYAPVSGQVLAVNALLAHQPEQVNKDPYGEGWMIEVQLADASEVDALISPEAYADSIQSAGH